MLKASPGEGNGKETYLPISSITALGITDRSPKSLKKLYSPIFIAFFNMYILYTIYCILYTIHCMFARERCWEKIFRNYYGVVRVQFTECFLFRKVKGGGGETRLSFLNWYKCTVCIGSIMSAASLGVLWQNFLLYTLVPEFGKPACICHEVLFKVSPMFSALK